MEDSFGRGIDADEDSLEQKPFMSKQILVAGSNSQRVSNPTVVGLRTPIEDSTNNSDSVSYRLVPLKVDAGMDSLTEGESSVPISPILATHLSSGASESRVALITSQDTPVNSNPTVIVSGGVAYFISDATSVCAGNRTSFLSRTTDSVLGQRMATTKDEKRRVTHNEVERRRRDKINNWICRLAKILPECPDIQTKNSNQVSKGVILSKACDYIDELKKEIRTLSDKLALAELDKSTNQMSQEIEILKKENDKLKNDNAVLKAHLQLHGVILSS